MIVTCDLVGGWSVVEDESLEFGIRFTNGDSQRFSLDELSFGWSWSDGEGGETFEWPPSNITIRELSVNRVFSYSPAWISDTEVTVQVWASNAGVTHTSEVSFVVPRPPQPFPSWVWDGSEWVAPVPEPEDGRDYIWSEELLSWVALDDGSGYDVE